MRIAICDDQPEDQTIIKNYCEALGYPDLSFFSSGEELLKAPDLDSFSLLFLDIELNGISGIDVKNDLEHNHPCILIVFTTTHHELMPGAFGRNVISFLTKPFSERAARQCLDKAVCLTKDFYLIDINEKDRIPCGQIVYLHSENKYTIFHTESGASFDSRIPLKTWIKELMPLGFCPISRSAAINLKHYRKTQNRQAILTGDISLPISRRYLQTLELKADVYMRNLAMVSRGKK